MKKFLIALLCVFGVQNAYSGGPGDIADKVDRTITEYFAGRVDLGTAQALCREMFAYADEYNMTITYSSEGGGSITGDNSFCNRDDIELVLFFTMDGAEQIKNASIQPHSDDIQRAMEHTARNKCGRSEMSQMDRAGGFTFSADVNVECSKTDNRCVVTRAATSSSGENGFWTACCLIPITNFTSTVAPNRSDRAISYDVGNISLKYFGFVQSRSLTLNDFGYDCRPNM